MYFLYVHYFCIRFYINFCHHSIRYHPILEEHVTLSFCLSLVYLNIMRSFCSETYIKIIIQHIRFCILYINIIYEKILLKIYIN